METIKLTNLKLVNFKGIKEFELNANGQDTNVFGENGTGKTTLFDAFVWLLFGKDSNNSTKFDIKTLKDGKPVHKLNHEVEANLKLDGKTHVLKKSYYEKWTKKRGLDVAEHTGHTTDYFIDDVPKKKKEYEDFIKETVDEDVFKLLTNPKYFNEQLTDNKRRDLLLQVAGDITDEDVFNSDNKLVDLKEALGNRSVDDHKLTVKSKLSEINKELDRIPIRIDEINRGLPDLKGLDKNSITANLEKLLNDMDVKNDEINSIKNGAEVNTLKQKISDIDLKISNVRNEHTQNEQQDLYKLKTRLQEEQSNLGILRNDLRGQEQQKQSNEARIKDYGEQMNDLREQGKAHLALEFNHESECSCYACGQDLPKDQIEETKAKFNKNKSDLLEKVNKQGVELKGKVEELQQENESLQKDIDKVTDQGKKKASEIERLEEKVKDAESTIKPIEENTDYIKLNEEKSALKQQIEQLEQSVDESVQMVKREIEGLKEQRNSLQMDLSNIKQSEQSHERMGELEEQETKLNEEYEQLSKELFLIEEFTRTKVNMLESNINNKFKHARFKLFEEQINGGLREVCETTYKGVPYSSGLNNAAQINVGLDIINTLSDHYGVQAPIFVDNAESVNQLLDIESQLISLVVSDDEQLRIEIKPEKSEVA